MIYNDNDNDNANDNDNNNDNDSNNNKNNNLIIVSKKCMEIRTNPDKYVFKSGFLRTPRIGRHS